MDPAILSATPLSNDKVGFAHEGKPCKEDFRDVESGYDEPPLYPNISLKENTLRLAFIRKVHFVFSLQLIFTASVAGVVAFNHSVACFLERNPLLIFLALLILPISWLFLIYFCKTHSVNFLLLALFALSLSLLVGFSCVSTEGKAIWDTASIITAVVVNLSLHTFWEAIRSGHDFSCLAASLLIVITFVTIKVFIPLGSLSQTIYGVLAFLVFSRFIIRDTDYLIKRADTDEYIWASVLLYTGVLAADGIFHG